MRCMPGYWIGLILIPIACSKNNGPSEMPGSVNNDAPYPSRIYMAGIRVFPSLINNLAGVNTESGAGLEAFKRPFLTIWAGNDGGGLGSCEMQDELFCKVVGAAAQPHARLPEKSHFLQDDQGPEIARRIVSFIRNDGLITGNHQEACN